MIALPRLLLCWIFLLVSCTAIPQTITPSPEIAPGIDPAKAKVPATFRVALETLTELSGLAASRVYPGIFWGHNDSGNAPELMAFDQAGASRGVWKVAGAKAVDWEDLAIAPDGSGGWDLWIADTGQNGGVHPPVLYRVREPVPQEAGQTTPAVTATAERYSVRWPLGAPDCEALMAHPQSGDLYLIAKEAGSATVCVARRADMAPGRETALEKVAVVKLPGLMSGTVTGADISPDGRRAALCSYTSVALFSATPAGSFDSAWQEPPIALPVPFQGQRESICFTADGTALITSQEGARPEVRRTFLPAAIRRP